MVMNIAVCVCAGCPRLFTAPPPVVCRPRPLARGVVCDPILQAVLETYATLAEDGAVLL